MATSRYSTSVSLCEDTSKNFELFDLLKQADPNYAATEPARIKLYVFDGSKYVETTSGYFTAVDKDTFTVDMSYLPNFNGDLKVRVLGTDSTGNSFVLDLTINVTPVNDAPSGADESLVLANGDLYVLGLNDFGFTDPVEGDSLKSVLITTVPATGSLLLDGVAVIAGQEILAADIVAGKLTYTAPMNAGGAIGFDFQVRDTGGTDGCGGNDLDLTPNTITFNVPQPAQAVIGDQVWEDINGNGVQDTGEAGIAGVAVQLKDALGNVVQTTTTDASGNYSFNVDAGTYAVAIVTPAGYVVTEPDMGPSDATDSDFDAAGSSAPVTVAAGEVNSTIDAGLFRTAEIGDRVWLDTNKNGVLDDGEAGVQGVIVRLLNANGELVDGPVATDANGNYLFTNLRPGTYSVAFDKTTLPTGYSFTTRDAGSDAADSDADSATGTTIQTVLDSGESDKSWDAGIVANPGSISGTVREDLDNNDSGDTPIPGVTVQLKDSTGTVVQTTTTDANGNYTFNNVPAGTYTVVETNQPGYLDVSDIDGGNPNSITVTLNPGTSSTGNDFVDERPATLGDTVFEDKNANGVQDAGEAGIANVTVQLKDAGGNVVQSATTDANGNYSFSVTPGTYSVAVVKPVGYEITGQDLGGNDATDSDINAAGQTAPITLVSGENNPNVDAGFYKLAELGDKVWYDTNKNGVQDGGEAGVTGVKVSLLDAAGNVVTTQTTDTAGNYLFTNLKPGTYSVQFDKTTLPTGYSFTTRDAGSDAADSDADSATGTTIQTVLDSGESDKSWDAGIVANPGSISGTVREDLDNNNTGDTPIPGVTVQLKDSTGNVVQTTTTDANGNYTFNNVPAGTYTVVETNQPGYLDVSDIDGGNPNSIAVTLNPGATSTGNDFVDERPATLGDTVFEDKNANGVQDAGEAGIANVTVQLKDAGGNVVQSATTDANGNYSFSVTPGTYSVAVVKPVGYEITGQDLGGNEALDSDINAAGQTAPITLVSGENNPNVDAGFYKLAELGDKVWYDTNKNGVQDGGEAGVTGVKVSLLDAAGNVVTTQTTDTAGNYLFTNLKPGTYSVQFDKATLPTGYVFTSKDVGSDAADSDADSATGTTIQTVLDSGESDKSWDAGIVANPGSISGTVREDLDNNDSGDTPIPGVTVQLKDSTGTVVQTTTTDANGNYTFNNVPAGTYTVVETNQPGYLDVSDIDGGNPNSITVTLNPGTSSTGNDFVDERPATLGDTVFEDKNANGVQDAGEAGIANVTVQLKDAGGNVVQSATTDANGNYSFSVTPGTYSVAVVKPVGYEITGQDLGGNDATDSDINAAGQTAPITLVSGENNPNVDAGFYKLAELGDKVWYDTNKNGVQDGGEAGVTGVKVSLLDAAGNVVTTQTTDTAGNYLFTNLKPGTYSVQFDKTTLPTGYSFTTRDAGSDAADSDADSATGTTIQTVLDSGESDKSWDAGIVANPGSISGTVREDLDNNNTGDTPIPGVTVQLKDSTGNVVQTTTTDANGNYTFNNVPAGTYTVVETNQPGYLDVSDIDGGNPNSIAVTLNPGATSTGNDFVDERPATLGDTVFEDKNANGVQDAGEAGIANVTVQLKDAGGNVVQSATTDANGNYSFSVTPGTYSVAVVKPVGYEITGQDLGGNEALDSDINAAGQTAPITLVSGENNPNVDAGFYKLAELGDKVWYDTNKNGVQDGGEAGVTGVKVSLLDAAGNVVTTQTTDTAGNYLFTNLKPGTYSVQFDKATLPTGYVFTSKDVGSDAADSDADSATGTTIQTVLDSGESDKSWDAGIVANPGSISGTVREDLDNNDSGDTPIPGVTVQLKDSTGTVVQTTTTDANGNYTFNNVPAGTYTVVETNQPGYLDVSDIDGGNPNSIAVTLAPGATSTGNDFVDERTAAIGDKVWLDKNANGVQDAGEAGLAGVTVKLLDSAGTVVGSSTTDANGNYLFSSLTPGDYAVQVVAPTGYTVSGKDLGGNDATDSDIDPTTGKTITTTLSAGETDLTWDAGLYQKASIGDKVWLDTNKNGVQDGGEAGITGVTVKLLNAAGTVVASATTDANGNYLFKDLVPGDYSVQVVAPAGYAFTSKDLGGNDATDSDVDQTTGKTITTTLESGENDLSWDAGLSQQTASIGDKIFYDTNANGIQDAGEAGVQGVVVELRDANWNVLDTRTTDAGGNYRFDDVAAGQYRIDVQEWTLPSGYAFTAANQGTNDAVDSDVINTGGHMDLTVLDAGEVDLSWDAGIVKQPASYGDKVWLDKNANGVQDAGEAGLAGVTVKLLNSVGSVVSTTTTDTNGNYLFNNLVPGDYSAQVVAPTGYFVSAKDQGGNDAIDSDIDPTTGKTITTTLAAGEADLSWDAGLYQKASIGDKVWADCNNNGIQDGTEAGVCGVTVKLLDASGTVVATALTDINGNYQFKDLMPGSYAVQVVAPTGYALTTKDQGTSDAVDSDMDQATGKSVLTTLESGENDLSWDAGLTVKSVGATFDFSGSSATDGTNGNIRSYTSNGISVNTSAWSRDKTYGTWSSAWLGSYGGGLGVTDSSEGSGSDVSHTVDNVGRDNFVLFEFSQSVVVDKAYLGYVVNDSDVKVWIGTVNGAFDSHITLSDAVLTSMGFTEVNQTTLTSARWADLNAAGYVGNVLIIAADTTDTSPEDYFKIDQLVVNTASAFCATDVSIGDKVWEDSNANGVQDAGEAGIAGVTVKLLNSVGTVIATTTTDASGNYLFDKLAAGSYKVQVVTPSGYIVTTKDASVATDATDSDIDASGISGLYTLTQGSNNLTVDAGFYKPLASIGDKVWVDSNNNGIQDTGEAGYSGATVKLLNAAGTVVATTTTDVNGNYKFSNVVPGDYSVQVLAPSGYVFSAKDQGTNDAIDSDVDVTTGKTIATTLVAGENDLTWDAGIYCPPTTASIGDKVWEDMNFNGVQDAGEVGIQGVTVKLLNAYGTVVATTTTDASGNYLFSNVNVGNYKVQVVAPTGYYYTKQNQGTNDAVDSDVDSTGRTTLTSLTAGESDKSWDAGLYRKASIGDKVWEDKDHDDIQDSTEPGIGNVKVSLQNASGTTIATTYTDASGNYKFTNLDPGSYRVVFDKSATTYLGVDMSKWYWAAKNIGTDDTKDADAYGTYDVATTAYTTLVSGEADMTWDAAITPIVLDLDQNGIQTIAREDATGKFDLLGNGKAISSGWISAGDAFLAIDIDNNGKVDNLSELFGGTSKGDGFAKLEAFDSNGDGFVNAQDAHFGDLLVWQDLNGNHQTDAGELRTLVEAGVASLKVDFVELPAVDAQGNLHLERSSAVMADGSSIDMADVYFNVSVADAADAGVVLPSLSALLGDDHSLDVVLGTSTVTAACPTADASAAAASVSDGAVTALGQLANLYDEQQFALMAA